MINWNQNIESLFCSSFSSVHFLRLDYDFHSITKILKFVIKLLNKLVPVCFGFISAHCYTLTKIGLCLNKGIESV